MLGYAHHRIILDEEDRPADFEFLEVNATFERIIGLPRGEIIYRNAKEIFTSPMKQGFDWPVFYGPVALEGKEKECEFYSESLGKWYRVQAYSVEKYYFSTILKEITYSIEFAKASRQLNTYSGDNIDYQEIAGTMLRITGAAYVSINIHDPDGDFTTVAISGIGRNIRKAITMLGFEVEGKKWKRDDHLERRFQDRKAVRYLSLKEMAGGSLPDNVIRLIEKVFDLGQVVVIRSFQDERTLADFILYYTKGEVLGNQHLAETYADMVGAALLRIETEKKLHKREAHFRDFYENTAVGIYQTTPEGEIIMANPSLVRMLGYDSLEELKRRNLSKEGYEPGYSRRKFVETIERDGYVRGMEARWVLKDGSTRYYLENARRITDEEGNTLFYEGSVEDITTRKEAEEEIRRQLEEKETIITEVNHRIKNNFAAVESLMQLQLESVENPEAISALQDALSRVQSMRVLYDKLLISETQEELRTRDYLETLIHSIAATFPERGKISINTRIEDFPLPSRLIFNLGIIINELMTNSMKYAFPDREKGNITVSLERHGKHATIIVQDNGIGLPEGFDPQKSQGFGLMLVSMLSSRHEAGFTMESRNGTRCELRFDF